MRVYFQIVLATVVLGCASNGFLMAKPKVTLFGSNYPPKGLEDQIDVFSTSPPTREYIEIAKISCGDTSDDWNMKQITMKAREVGADAIILGGRSGSWGVNFSSGLTVTEEYGISAIAIKYKDVSQ